MQNNLARHMVSVAALWDCPWACFVRRGGVIGMALWLVLDVQCAVAVQCLSWVVYPRKLWHFYILQLCVQLDLLTIGVLALAMNQLRFMYGVYSWCVTGTPACPLSRYCTGGVIISCVPRPYTSMTVALACVTF